MAALSKQVPRKRPAAKKTGALAKKPAMGTTSTKDLVKGLKKIQETEDNDDGSAAGAENGSDEEGGGSSGSNARDKGKAEKFAAMMRSKSLPEHIAFLHNEGAREKTSPREFRTAIINQLFTRKVNGRYSLNDTAPLFQEARRVYEKKFNVDKQIALPKLVLRGMHSGNSESAFQEALAAGEIQAVESDA